ncbi:MAG TPA: replication initiation and membrane attachment family protein [Bacillales bacterium]|nr:replication initiation and membrane attachment family protein [Bacillales bacterium]
MSEHWKSILPVDRYTVRLNGVLHDFDRKVLTRLYQPLMGAGAYSLYMTLWSEVNEDELWGAQTTHHQLMAVMQLNLRSIFYERKKLEGLSLLNTFVKEDEEGRSYLYELEPPLDPEHFFNNDVLSVYLFNRIGEHKYRSLKRQFTAPAANFRQYRKVTASFDEAFQSVKHSELVPTHEISAAIQPDGEREWLSRKGGQHVSVSSEAFDFEEMMTHLSGLIVPKEAITETVKEAAAKLAFVYNITPMEMSKRIERAFVEGGGALEIERLRKEVEQWYAFENDNTLPSLSFRTQPLNHQTMANKVPQTEEEKIIRAFETYSPAELLEQIAGGAKPALSDLRIVESIMFEQKLPPGVVNVLIDYVMTTNDMKLNRNYVEKIASHWARKKVNTVEQAMALARSEHRKYQDWVRQKRPSTGGASRKPKRSGPLPKWMTENKKETDNERPNWDSLREQLEKELKQL